MNRQEHKLMQIIEKINVFNGFEVKEVQRLLFMCSPRKYAVGEVVYKADEPSINMLILLTGKLQVVSKTGEILGEIPAGTTTGEIGILTGRTRSATVIALEPAAGMMITKEDLSSLMGDLRIHAKVFENLVDQLCDRLMEANQSIENYSKTTREAQKSEADEGT